jgi:hypothetical protein
MGHAGYVLVENRRSKSRKNRNVVFGIVRELFQPLLSCRAAPLQISTLYPHKMVGFQPPLHVSHVISHVTGCIPYHWFYVQNLFNSNPIPVMPPSYTYKIVAFILDASSNIILYIYITFI